MVTRANLKLKLRLTLLLGLMLAAQGGAFAHEFDHLSAGDYDPCLICPIGSNVETAAADSGAAVTAIILYTAKPPGTCTFRVDSRFIRTTARGPPTFL
jgi:hypothetical protein